MVSTGAGKVAAWFVDSDDDAGALCLTPAFLRDRGARKKSARGPHGKDGSIAAKRSEACSGVVTLPFAKGEHQCTVVKVIDLRGNEAMAVERVK
jgi:adenine-specific DNA-methyltransferase